MTNITNITMSDYDYLVKLVLIGDSGTGKTNLMLRYTKNQFDLETKTTIGVEFSSREINIEHTKYKYQIWDTAGQERFQGLATAYFRGAKICIIVYDITKYETFVNVNNWLKKVRDNCDPDVQIYVIGNKIDLEHLRSVSKEEGIKYCKENDLVFAEVSALRSTNIEELFYNIGNDFHEKIKRITGSDKEDIQERYKYKYDYKNPISIVQKPIVKETKCCV
jgi:small GTP-binding protein